MSIGVGKEIENQDILHRFYASSHYSCWTFNVKKIIKDTRYMYWNIQMKRCLLWY